MKFVNYTPHTIVLNDGREFKSLGIARVEASFTDIEDDVCTQVLGAAQGLPDAEEGVRLIVSGMVLSASSRSDLVAPATGHPLTVRNDKGHIVSVPCFVM
jgi:hypothetical protein